MLRVATLIQARAGRTAAVGQFLRFAKAPQGGFRTFTSTPVIGSTDSTSSNVSSTAENLNTIQQNVDAVAVHNAVDAFQTVVAPTTAEMGYSLAEIAIRTLDVVHATSGLPWWATIIATTFVVRSAFFPVSVMSMKNSARMAVLQPKLEKLQNEIKSSSDAYDPVKMDAYKKRATNLFKEHQVRPFMSFLMPVSQLPIFLGFFWGLQEISKHIPSYANDGAFWFENLASPDPLYILPVVSSALMVASLEAGGEGMPAEYIDKAKMGMRMVALIMIPVSMNFESGILLYWVSSNVFTLTQTLVLKIPGMKKTLGIPETSVQAKAAATTVSNIPSPFQAAVAQAQKNQPFVKSDNVTEYTVSYRIELFMTRPASAPFHNGPSCRSPVVRKAIAHEPFLGNLFSRQQTYAVDVQARVTELKRQKQDFVEQDPPPTIALSISVPHIDVDEARRSPSFRVNPLTKYKKSRPKSTDGRLKTPATLAEDSVCSTVKHPMRLVASKLIASLETHVPSVSNDDKQCDEMRLINSNQTPHAYFYELYMQVCLQLQQHQPTGGLAEVLTRIWNRYIEPMHSRVEKANRLGLTYGDQNSQHYNQVTKRMRARTAESTSMDSGATTSISNIVRSAVPLNSTTVMSGKAEDASQPNALGKLCRRNSSSVRLSFKDVDQVSEIRKILSAKVKALRLELISMQRLRESIFATVKNADASRQKDNEARMRVKIGTQLEQNLFKRYSMAPMNMHDAAVQIQRVARGKLAGKRIRFARIVSLMRLTNEVFRQKLCANEWSELDDIPDNLSIEQLEEQMKIIVWEVTRLVRDLSLDWWKLSLSEERARLAWELNDARDDLRHIQTQASILVQNCSFCIRLVNSPLLTKDIEDRIGVYQYYSPSPRVVDSAKEMLEIIQQANTNIEDFMYKHAKAKEQKASIHTQTDKYLSKQPTYLEALQNLAKLQAMPQTDDVETEASIDDVVSSTSDAESLIHVERRASIQSIGDTSQGKRSPLKNAKAVASFPGMRDVPPDIAAMFKLIGKIEGHKPRCMGIAPLKLLLHEIYSTRMADELRTPLAQFLYRFFARKYGLRHVAEVYLVNFIASLKKYSHHDTEIRLCARVCHMKRVPALSLDAFDYYISLLESMGSHRNEIGVPVWFMPHLLRKAVDLIAKFEPDKMLELVNFNPDNSFKDIELRVSRLPPVAKDYEIGFNSSSQSYINRDDTLAICLDMFEVVEKSIHNHLISTFNSADIDQNGALSFAEFNSMVQKVVTTPETQVERMFFEAIALSGNPLHDSIQPEVFVTLAKKEGLSRKSYVDERRGAITAPLDPQTLLDLQPSQEYEN